MKQCRACGVCSSTGGPVFCRAGGGVGAGGGRASLSVCGAWTYITWDDEVLPLLEEV